MRIIFTLLAIGVLSANSFAQRFMVPVFDSVLVNADIFYGHNKNVNGDSTALFMDLYFPYGDTLSKRPMVVLAHGGSFVQGNRKSTDMIKICTSLAKRGYVVASIQYRLGISLTSGNPLDKEFRMAVWRGTQDGRAAIRFLRKHIAEGNTWKLDNDEFYTGGVSAGGVLGLHLACLDNPEEVGSLGIDTVALGGIEGNSGSPGYSWRVKGVVSLCGALGDVSWINDNRNVSICNMHGDQDRTVPYKTDYFKFLNSPVAILQGSFSVDSAARMQSMDTRLYTLKGADHVPFVGLTDVAQAYMDTTIIYISAYLHRMVTGIIPVGSTQIADDNAFSLYPNPANDQFRVVAEKAIHTIRVYNMQGAEVYVGSNLNKNETQIEGNALGKGIFFIECEMLNGKVVRRKLLLQ